MSAGVVIAGLWVAAFVIVLILAGTSPKIEEPKTCDTCNGEGWVFASGNVIGIPVRLCPCGGSGKTR